MQEGFRGHILATAATRDLARVVLLDAAGLQEEKARRAQRNGRRCDEAANTPLYTLDDAFHTPDFFADPVSYGDIVPLAPGVQAQSWTPDTSSAQPRSCSPWTMASRCASCAKLALARWRNACLGRAGDRVPLATAQ